MEGRSFWTRHGHACGVRVHRVQRVQRVQRGGLTALRAEGCGRLSAAGCVRFAQGATAPTALKVAVSPSRAMSFISRLRRSRQHRVSILPAYLVHPFPLRGTSPQGETRALRDLLSVSYGKITILLTGSLRSPPPIRLRRAFHLKVKRLTMICASLALLHPLLSLTHWIFRSLMLPYKSSSHSANHVRCASTGKRVTRFSGRFASLQHGYHRLTIFCASLRSFKICSLV